MVWGIDRQLTDGDDIAAAVDFFEELTRRMKVAEMLVEATEALSP